MQRLLYKLPYFLCYAIAFVFGIKQLREPDVWWQLLTGRWMLENGQITRTDIFSYTMYGHKWVNVKWLYEVIIAFFERGLGPEAVILLQAVVNVGILWALFYTLRQMQRRLQIPVSGFATIVAALLFFVITEYRMAGRPEMISHLMCALYIYYLWHYPAFKWKHIIVPVVLQCIWANMHEGYPVGIVILGVYTGGSMLSYGINRDKGSLQTAVKAGVMTIFAIVAILINPNGIQLWKQPFEIYRQVWANKYTTELYAYTDAQYWTVQAKLHIAVMLAVCLFWIVRIRQAVKQRDSRFLTPVMLGYLLLIPLFSYLSLTANRNIPFAQIIFFPTLPVMAAWLIDIAGWRTKNFYTILAKNSNWITTLMCIILYVSIVNNKYYKATDSPNRYGIHVSMLHNPTGAAAFIKDNHIDGLGFSDYFVSSYLLWSLYPEFKSYIDLRDLDIFSEKFFDQYFSLYENPKLFRELDKKYHFNYVVISTNQLPALQKELYWGEGFNQIYVDPVTVIYIRMDDHNKYLNENFSMQKLFFWPAAIEDPAWASMLTMLGNPGYTNDAEDETNAPVYAGKYYNEIGNYPLALRQLRPAMYDLQDDADANLTIGNTYVRYGAVMGNPVERKEKIDSADYYLQRAKELDPKKAATYLALANVSIIRSNYSDAIDELKEYLKREEGSDYVYFLYGICHRALWKNQQQESSLTEMKEAMRTSVNLNPKNGKAYLYMAEASVAENHIEEARSYLKKAISSGNALLPDEEKLLNEMKVKTGLAK